METYSADYLIVNAVNVLKLVSQFGGILLKTAMIRLPQRHLPMHLDASLLLDEAVQRASTEYVQFQFLAVPHIDDRDGWRGAEPRQEREALPLANHQVFLHARQTGRHR